jgi:hypothetical protein
MSGAIGMMSVYTMYLQWSIGDDVTMWGSIQHHPVHVLVDEIVTLFVTSLCMDLVIATAYGMLYQRLIVHHCISMFGVYILLHLRSVVLYTIVFLAQEITGPVSNVYVLLRGFNGHGNRLTQMSLMLLASLYSTMRIGCVTVATGMFLIMPYETVIGDIPHFIIPIWFCVHLFMQYIFFVPIMRRLRDSYFLPPTSS